MSHADNALNERLATQAEMPGLLAQGLPLAPKRQLAVAALSVSTAITYPAWLAWPILAMAATTISLVVIR